MFPFENRAGLQQRRHKHQYSSSRHCLRTALGIVLIGNFLLLCLPTAQGNKIETNRYIEIPFGPPVVIDGAISPGEWEGAGFVKIVMKPGWIVRVLYKHDATNLYFAFEGLKHEGEERYPEILIASRRQKGNSWKSGDLWFHASYNLCEGNGEYGAYYRDAIFQCSRTKPGWSANLYPLAQNHVVEFQISLSKLNANIKPESLVRIAFAVTDTQKKWDLWPPGADLQRPNTWGEALIKAATHRLQPQGFPRKDASVDTTRFVRLLDSFVPKRMHELRIPGAAVALVYRGEVVWSKGYGVANKATGEAVTPETVFQAASISKSVTAWGVMRLVEEGKLVLDAPVEGYLTRWHLPASQFDRSGVTIRRLLSHTSGLSVRGYAGLQSVQPLPNLEQSLSGDTRGGGAVHLEMQPGSGFSYSGGGYTVLQLVVEEVTHEKFSDYMQREVLRPLGMEQSSFECTPEIQVRTASAYDRSGNQIPNYLYTEEAAAGLYTTADDLAKFVAASMTGPNGEPPGRGVLTPQAIRQMISPAPATKGTYGLGFQIQELPGGLHMVYHAGGNPGWGAIFAELAEKHVGLVVLTNSDPGEILATQAAFALAAQPLYRPMLWTALALALLLCFFVGWIGFRLGRGYRQWGWGSRKAGWLKFGCATALALVACIWWLGWYSDIVLRAIGGLNSVLPTDEMPATFRWLTLVITVWCLVGIASCFTHKPEQCMPNRH